MITCENYFIRDFKSKDLEELSFEILKFHQKVGTKYFANSNTFRTYTQKINSVKEDLNDLINSCDYNLCCFCKDTNKLFAFCCFRTNGEICENPFIFKSESFKMNNSMFSACKDYFNSMKALGYKEIHTIIDRKDPKRYLKFLNKFYNITVKEGDPIKVIFHI